MAPRAEATAPARTEASFSPSRSSSSPLHFSLAGPRIRAAEPALPCYLPAQCAVALPRIPGVARGLGSRGSEPAFSQQEAAHEEARILMRGYAKDGDNPAIKRFASDTLKAVNEHLAMVEKIEKDMKTASR